MGGAGGRRGGPSEPRDWAPREGGPSGAWSAAPETAPAPVSRWMPRGEGGPPWRVLLGVETSPPDPTPRGIHTHTHTHTRPHPAQRDLKASAIIFRPLTLTLGPSLSPPCHAHGPHKHILTYGVFVWNFLHLS